MIIAKQVMENSNVFEFYEGQVVKDIEGNDVIIPVKIDTHPRTKDMLKNEITELQNKIDILNSYLEAIINKI